ncbi:heme oxygenase [Bradyrhizobium sp. AT1]|nr:biliverdin-producing heme oxygenase [Bradyrhizobium sp. AT1]KYG21516.1 heme oxygenase [Bradyrhizobium sp. AT1]
MLVGASDVTTHAGRSHSGLRQRLRDATSDAHRELDAQLSAFDLSGLAGYRRFLGASAGALLPLEAALADAGVDRIFPDWPERSRSAAIAADLGRLGATASPAVSVPPLTHSGMLGTMYVLEGSRLGAKFLLKTVADANDPRIREACTYLRHGAGRRLWQSFLSKLESEEDCNEVEVIAAARVAFAAFEQAADRA